MGVRKKRLYWILGGLASLLLLLLAGGYLMLYSIGDAFWGSFEDWDQSQEPWIEVGFELPDSSEKITLLRQHAHPFLAEYDRKVRLEPNNQPMVTIELPMNTGGKTMINVYLDTLEVENGERVPVVQLKDRYGVYVIDLRNQRIVDTTVIGLDDSLKYIGRFDGRTGELRYLSAVEAEQEVIEKPGAQ
jgi:hypothetical protein